MYYLLRVTVKCDEKLPRSDYDHDQFARGEASEASLSNSTGSDLACPHPNPLISSTTGCSIPRSIPRCIIHGCPPQSFEDHRNKHSASQYHPQTPVDNRMHDKQHTTGQVKKVLEEIDFASDAAVFFYPVLSRLALFASCIGLSWL